jgi:hypothetical protein
LFLKDCSRQEGTRNRVFFESLCHQAGPGMKYKTTHANAETWYYTGVTGCVLAFDIETTGLSDRDSVTCVCAYDADRGIAFSKCIPDGSCCEDFLVLLDEAPCLTAFNGVKFDVPFITKRWNVAPERVGAWIKKLVDPFEACKLALRKTFSLNKLLEKNDIDCKTGSGKEAVEMAKQGRWAELELYCMNDTKKTHDLVKKNRLLLP